MKDQVHFIDADLQNLTALIQKGFATDENVEVVFTIGRGANQATHFEIRMDSGNSYGLKTCSRGVADGDDY